MNSYDCINLHRFTFTILNLKRKHDTIEDLLNCNETLWYKVAVLESSALCSGIVECTF